MDSPAVGPGLAPDGLTLPGAGGTRNRWIGRVVVALALIAVTTIAIRSWESWTQLLSTATLWPLLLALAAGLLGQFLNSLIAHESLQAEGLELPVGAVYRILSLGGLAKFLPGGIWQIGSQYGLGKLHGLDFRQSMLAWLEPTAFNLTIGAALALSAASVAGYGVPAVLLLAGSAVALMISTDPVRRRAYRMLRLLPPGAAINLPWRSWAVRSALTAVIIALTGAGGLLVMSAFGLAAGPGYMGATAAFTGAWVLGVLVFPVPGGLGVREGALLLLLAPWMTTGEAALVATSGRLVAVGSELVAALIAVGLTKQLAATTLKDVGDAA